MAEFEYLKDQMHLWSLEVVDGIKNELDKRNIGGQAFQAAQILDEVKNTHTQMISTLTNIGNCTRTQPVVQQDVQQQEAQNLPNFDDKFVIRNPSEEEAESA
eukprot:4040751-Ditylum_brightwellii.AAC.1